MTKYTDAYKAAQRAGAKPLFLLYIGTDMGLRCFGKETPHVDHVGDESFEWSARILQFGDLRQSVSSDSDSVIQDLLEEEIGTYTATLDNADNYFSRIAGRETFLNGFVELMQGFDVPGFLHSDFLSLFSGQIVDFETSKMTFQFTAKQAVKADAPEDPSVDTSKIYTLSNGGSGFTAASEVVPYDDMEPVFYAESSWVYTMDIHIDTVTTPSILFAIENAGDPRLEIGIDSDDKLYLKYTEDVTATTPTYTTLTSSVTLAAGEDYRVSVDFDDSAGTVTLKDGKGQINIIDLTPIGGGFVLENTWASLAGHRGMDVDLSGKIYVANYQDDRVDIYNADGTFDTSFGSSGTGDGQFQNPFDVAVDGYGNIYVTDGTRYDVQKFDSSHNFVLKFGSRGAGDGQFYGPAGVCVSTDDSRVYVSDLSSDRIQSFSSLGAFIAKGGSSGSGDGNLDQPTGISCDSLDNVYVCDFGNNRIVKFTSSLSWISNLITGVNYPRDIVAHSSYLYFTTLGSPVGVHKYTNTGTSLYSYSLSSLPYGLTYNPTTGSTYCSIPGINFYDLSEDPGSIVLPDFSDTGTDDTIVIGEDFDGDTTTCGLNDTFLLVNEDQPAATDFPDIASGIDVGVIDGTWTEVWTIDEYITEIVPEEQADATEEIILPDTSLYPGSGPNQQNVILPLPYGDLSENSDQGVWVSPLINQDDFVYCVAGWPILSVSDGNAISVFVDGVLTPSGWTFDESVDYQSQGEIATLTFASDPGGDVTVFCKGKAPGGTLLTNPIDIVSDFVDYAAGLVGNSAWQKDLSSLAKATSEADLAGYVGAGVIQANNSLGYWIKAMLKPFLGSFRFSETGLLQVSLQPTTESANVFETVEEYEATTVKAKQNIDNICGKILVNYAISYATIDRRFKNNSTTSYFRTAYATQDALNPQTWKLDFDWCRRTVNIETVQNILLALYADPEYIIDYQGQDFKFVPLNMLDQLSTTLSFLLDDDGSPFEDVVCSLRHKTINMDTFTTTMSMQTLNFIDISPVVDNQLQFGGVDVQFGGVNVNFGGE